MRLSLSAMTEIWDVTAAQREHESAIEIQLDCSRLLGTDSLHLQHCCKLCGKQALFVVHK